MSVTNSTLLINTVTGEYPVYLSKVRRDNPNVSFPQTPSEELIASMGLAVVQPRLRPEGDVVTEGTPELVDGVYHQVWEIRTYNEEELAQLLLEAKNERARRVSDLRDSELAMGLEYLFPDATVGHVQLRAQDQINLHSLRAEAMALKAAGQTEAVIGFRNYENVTKMMTPEQVLEMIAAALVFGKKIYQASWDLKDQIDAATNIDEIPVIPNSLANI